MTLELGVAYQEFLADWCERAEQRLAKHLKIAKRRQPCTS